MACWKDAASFVRSLLEDITTGCRRRGSCAARLVVGLVAIPKCGNEIGGPPHCWARHAGHWRCHPLPSMTARLMRDLGASVP